MIARTKDEIAAWMALPSEERAAAFLDFLIDWWIVARGTDEEYAANVATLAKEVYGPVDADLQST